MMLVSLGRFCGSVGSKPWEIPPKKKARRVDFHRAPRYVQTPKKTKQIVNHQIYAWDCMGI